MWGFKVEKARKIGQKIFKLFRDKRLMGKFNRNGKSPKGSDQEFLSKYVYNEIKDDSIVHDSFLCKNYQNSEPWPTQRKGNCFVGRVGKFNESGLYFKCPFECRPEQSKNWESC